ncbi:unnamed protein product [Periconia digitata]|uniref:t-SNARE coiled-coil homology domain-containing protein n=1 Tax=Periconia digitata TaxID=1303443 RepID=A0A9W4UFU9_9PLEO|nr:unnamed protein product [Periconia digitata]
MDVRSAGAVEAQLKHSRVRSAHIAFDPTPFQPDIISICYHQDRQLHSLVTIMNDFGLRKSAKPDNGPAAPSHSADNSYGNSTTADSPCASSNTYKVNDNGRSGMSSHLSNDADRAQLLGNSATRTSPATQPYQQRQQSNERSGVGSGMDAYGSYNDRQLTKEEEEEEDIQATTSEIRMLKQSDVSSTRNAPRLAQQAEQTGRDTLSRLGEHGNRIHHTERHLDSAASQNEIAEEKTRELKTVNLSKFAPHIKKPFTSSSRQESSEARILESHQRERTERDASRSRANYQFEADSDDDITEDEIRSNLNARRAAADSLKYIAGDGSKEVDRQNIHLERIMQKTDRVEDQLALNRAKLDRIR